MRSAPACGRRISNAFPQLVQSALGLATIRSITLSERYRFMHHAVVMGRGLNYSNAFEFALKLMETCYVIAERFSSADFQHGPIAMVEQGFPVFLFAPSGVTWPGVERHGGPDEGAQRRNGRDHGPEEHRGRTALGCALIALPDRIPEFFTPIPYIVPAQLFAACLAAQKGLNPDQPRTLNKVTKTL